MDSNELKGVVDEIAKDQTELGADPADNDATDWKAEALKARGIAKRNATRLEKLKGLATKVETPGTEINNKTKTGFDYAEKAYLKTSGIAPSEFDFVKEVMSSTGKSLDELLESKYFQAELKERRAEIATKEAIPAGSKRAAPSSRDEVDYWLAKGVMPPADQPELRSKYVKAKIASEKQKTQFSSRPVVR